MIVKHIISFIISAILYLTIQTFNTYVSFYELPNLAKIDKIGDFGYMFLIVLMVLIVPFTVVYMVYLYVLKWNVKSIIISIIFSSMLFILPILYFYHKLSVNNEIHFIKSFTFNILSIFTMTGCLRYLLKNYINYKYWN